MSAEPRDALHALCRADPVWNERYEGWTELGHGGSATVVRTHGKALGEDVALKVFPHLSRDEWTRFRQEVSTAQRLTSPFIVRTYSPFPRGGFAWIELELIEGSDLRHELERRAREGRPFALEQVLEVGVAVASALSTAHEAGVTHRDVKPANILLPDSGRPAAKLGDFGISRLAGAARLTQTGLLVGTPQFAAPEVAAGAVAAPAADVYACALCLYLMLSGGRPPFAIEDERAPAQWLRAHEHQAPRPITDFDQGVPSALAELLERALDKDPEERPTAAQMAARLDALRRREQQTDQTAHTAPTHARARRRAVLMAAGISGLVLAGASVTWRASGSSDLPPGAPAAAAAARPAPPVLSPAASVAPTPAPRASASAPPPAHVATPAPSPAAPAVTARLEDAVPEVTLPAEPELRSAPPEPTPAPPAATPAPMPTPAAAVVAAPRNTRGLHLEELLRARPVAIGRREGLPGQREMTLVDALHGEEWIWFRFKLDAGASLRIARVWWEQGDIESYVQEPSGQDLRVVVEVPRAAVSRRGRLSLQVDDGPAYTFALGSRSLGRFLKELFQ